MSSESTCRECGTAIPADGPGEFCAQCLLGLGLNKPEDQPESASNPVEQDPDSSKLPHESESLRGAASGFSSLTEKSGDRVGRYRLLEEIGHGGCGVVYMAEQEKPVRRKVALKVIKLGMDTRQVVARFEAERQALALMDHPNIAKVLEAGATETGRPYFVMELVSGIKITDYCDQNHLTTRQRLDLFIQVCRAIQHAHQKGIIHRDIKPSNVLVTTQDGMAVPKVIDFGIAKATQGRLTDQTFFTAFEQFLGTPAYMSPEQTDAGGLDIDTRSDIYSLGVLLYELLTGKTPFDTRELIASGLDEMRRTIRELEPVKPSTRLAQEFLAADKVGRVTPCAPPGQTTPSEDGAHGVTRPTAKSEIESASSPRRLPTKELIHLLRGDLDWIVMKCLEKDRARRYETASGLARDIERHLNNEPVLARPPSTAYRTQKFVRRNKLVVTAAAAIATVLVLGVLVSAWQAVRAAREARLAESEGARARLAAETLGQNLYVADVGLAFQAWESGNAGRARELLEQQRPRNGETDLRGFEWYYLNELCRTQELFTFPPGPEPIFGLACSPDGRLAAVGQQNGKVRLLDIVGRRDAGWLQAPDWEKPGSSAAYSVAFSPDGKRLIATSVTKRRLDLWDVQSQRYEGALVGHTNDVIGAQFSPDGQLIVSTACELYNRTNPGQIFLWDAHTRARLFALSVPAANSWRPAFSPDGRLLATPHSDGTIILWDLTQRERLKRTFGPHRDIVSCVCFSPDGKQFATASMDQTVRLWNVGDGQEYLVGWHNAPVDCVVFSRDGRWLASSSRDHTVKLWEARDLSKSPVIFRGHSGRIWSLDFSPDSQTLVSGSLDRTVRLWDVGALQNETILNRDSAVLGLRFSPDGLLTGRSQGGRFLVRDLVSGRLVAELPTSDAFFSPNGELLVAIMATNSFSVWNTRDFTLLTNVQTEAKLERPPCFSPDGQLLAIRRSSNAVEFRDTSDWQLHHLWKPGEGGKNTSEDLVYSAISYTMIGLGFSPDGELLALASGDGSVRIYALSSRRQVRRLQTGLKRLNNLAWLPHSRTLAVASRLDSTVQLWDLARQDHKVLNSEAGNVFAIAVSPDSKTLAVGTQDGTVVLWNLRTLRQMATLKAHLTYVGGLAFSPDGQILVSQAGDGVRVWRGATAVEGSERSKK